MESSHVADELAIRGLVARYAEAVTRNDPDAWEATWASYGEWHVMGQTAKGREEARKLFEKLTSGFDFVAQLAGSGYVEIAGDEAVGHWQMTEHGRLKSGAPIFTIGLYEDRYRREDGEWRFLSRRFKPAYVGPPDMSADPIPLG